MQWQYSEYGNDASICELCMLTSRSFLGQPITCESTLTVCTEGECGWSSIPVHSLSPVSSCKITWSQPLTAFSYNIIDGEVEDGRYSITINNITMNRSSELNIELRMFEACASNVTGKQNCLVRRSTNILYFYNMDSAQGLDWARQTSIHNYKWLVVFLRSVRMYSLCLHNITYI